MAVAEARAAWQRTANRCFVQEDAKRAPKLACCPSSAASTKQIDSGPASAADGQDYYVPGFFPLNSNPSYINVPHESRWWLQLQPNYGYQRSSTNEQLNTLEAEMDTFRAGFASLNVRPSRAHLKNEDGGEFVTENSKVEPSHNTHSRICASCIRKDPRVKSQELKAVYTKNVKEPLQVKDGEESYEFIEMDPVDCAGLKQFDELCFESGSPWIGEEKSEPWWRTADRDELASFVAQRSLNLIDNCDLPQPQKTHIKRAPNAHPECLDGNGILTSSVDWKPQTAGRSDSTIHTSSNGTSGIECGSNYSVEGNSRSGIYRPISSENTSNKATDKMQISEKDPSKAQLLEALMHSQTRAREAEMAAKQAYEEKEHVVKLFFKQAAHLFAYKQWFQLLQLENLYFQIKNNKNHPVSALFPVVLPWMPLKTRKMQKNWQKASKGKRAKKGHSRCNISNYTLMFAFGLSLVGAGLLLGWTVGWMFPAL